MTDAPAIVPHNIEAEQAVLGAIFVDPSPPSVFHEVASIIKAPEQFYRASHQHIYRAMLSLSKHGLEIDWIGVAEGVRKQGAIQACGGEEMFRAYLSEISHSVPSSYGADGYARIVRDRYVLREIYHQCGEIRAMVLEDTRTPTDVIARLERLTLELSQARYTSDFHNFLAVLNAVIEKQQAMLEWRNQGNNDALPGLSTGYSDLDSVLMGLKAGQLYTIGARPGQGKTSLALNVAENVALTTRQRRSDGRGGVLLFSLEMTAEEIVERVLCSTSHVELGRARMGWLRADEIERNRQAKMALADCQLHIDDTFAMNMQEIRAKAWRAKIKYDTELVVVDYLQLVKDNDRLDRHVQIGNISRALKALARELNIPVIACAQLNRGVDKDNRNNLPKRPMLADLRESGSIEQDSDVVLLIWPRYDRSPDWQPGGEPPHVYESTLCIAKHRGGPTADVDMIYHGKTTTFQQIKKPVFAGAPAGGAK